MAYNSAQGYTLFFGGTTMALSAGNSLETWKWDEKEWKEISPSGLEPRSTRMVYDSDRNRIVLFGGIIGGTLNTNSDTVLAGDTWEIELGNASGIPRNLWSMY